MPEGANVPALGLSNKAIFDNHENQTTTTTTSAVVDENPMTVDGLYKEGFFKAIVLNGELKNEENFHLKIFIFS